MEIGATICKTKQPQCDQCPLKDSCVAKELGTIDELPNKVKKNKRSDLHIVCAIIYDDENVWLEKNNSSRLFGGLYAPPSEVILSPNQIDDALRSILDQRQIPFPEHPVRRVILKRTLTHRDMTLYGFLIPAASVNRVNKNWIPKDQLDQIGLSTAIRTLLQQNLV